MVRILGFRELTAARCTKTESRPLEHLKDSMAGKKVSAFYSTHPSDHSRY